jgi:hypothetical protein
MEGRCPECEAGKHPNCTGWALNELDEEVSCACGCTYARARLEDEKGTP